MRAKEKSAQKTLRVTEERVGVSREMCSLDLRPRITILGSGKPPKIIFFFL